MTGLSEKPVYPLLKRKQKPINLPRRKAPQRRPEMMNETVYLFALSLPDLLDRIVAARDEVRARSHSRRHQPLERSEDLWM